MRTFCNGISTLMVQPFPGEDMMCALPEKNSARLCILDNPMPFSMFSAMNPMPLSVMDMIS